MRNAQHLHGIVAFNALYFGPMLPPDLNLLHMLDVLLSEGSVVRAAERLHLSPSAMSRALTRLRTVTGDPLLVRAGRGLVPTPRATAMEAKVHELVEEAFILLRPADRLELATLERSFTLAPATASPKPSARR